MFGNRFFSPYSTYGLGAATKSGINWSSLLSNTQKTLGIINQAIPAFYQIKPIFSNMKTMFKVVNEINRDDTKVNNNSIKNNDINDNNTNNFNNVNSSNNMVTTNNNYSNIQNDEGPSFFI